LLAADVVVINHTLLFMLLGSPEEQLKRETGYLFPNDFIIFDEAHTVEQTASRQIGIGVSQYGLRATVQRLYNARTKKGLFTVTRDAAGVALAAGLIDEIDAFFRSIDERCDFRKGREVRIREVDFAPENSRCPHGYRHVPGAGRRGPRLLGRADRQDRAVSHPQRCPN
jgi:ATP-dependent DNA helicase DinG